MSNKHIFVQTAALVTILSLPSVNSVAQEHNHAGSQAAEAVDKKADESPMDHSKMDHTPKSDMQHGNMQKNTTDMPKENTEMGTMQAMDHNSMPKVSDAPPADARDPHAYSNGLTLDKGIYALPGPRTLVLADEHAFWAVTFDRLEYADGLSNSLGSVSQYDAQAWYGKDYNRLVVKLEGEIVNNKLEESESQILWGRAFTKFWDTQLGVGFDNSEGPSREWLVFGVQGLAPYWFEVDTSLSVGTEGRTAFDLEAEYELLITQRLILQPRIVVSAFGKDDPENGVGKGLSSLTTGFRLRYEFSRKFAPYLGVEWTGQYGNTADFAKLAGQPISQTQWVAGIRFWF